MSVPRSRRFLFYKYGKGVKVSKPKFSEGGPPRRILLCFNTPVMYAVAKAIRPHVDFLAVALPEPHTTQGLRKGLAASRLFDASVWLPPSPVGSWSASAREFPDEVRRYISYVSTVSEKLDIDAIVPVNDAENFFFTLGTDQLAAVGVRILGSGFEAVQVLNDKYTVNELARKNGVPAPTTVLASEFGTERAPELSFPVTIKRRFSASSSSVRVFADQDAFYEGIDGIPEKERPEWAVQEFIEGNVEPSITAFVSPTGEASLLLQHIKHRYLGPSASTAVEIIRPFIEEDILLNFLRDSGAQGPVGIQFKVDRHDGVAKLIEVNPRLGQNTRLLFPMLAKLGYDPGLLLLESCAPDPAGTVRLPPGTTGVSPVDDLLAFGAWFRAKAEKGRPDNPIPDLRVFVRDVIDTYRKPVVVMDALFRSVLREPAVILPAYRRLFQEVPRRRVDLIPWTMMANTGAHPYSRRPPTRKSGFQSE